MKGRGDSVHEASRGGAVGRREDDDGGTESFLPTYVYNAMKVKKRFEHMRVSFPLVFSSSILLSFLLSSFVFFSFSFLLMLLCPIPSHDNLHYTGRHQEDAEEFSGLYLDTLEEELLAMLAAVSAPPSLPANTSSTNSAPGKNAKLGSVTGTTSAASAYMESESVVSHEDADGDGWLGIGIRLLLRVRYVFFFFFCFGLGCVAFFFQYFITSIHPSIPPSCLLTSLLTPSPIYSFTDRVFTHTQIKGTECPITRIFGGKFCSTLRAPRQKDSVLVEDRRALRLDIWVGCSLSLFAVF